MKQFIITLGMGHYRDDVYHPCYTIVRAINARQALSWVNKKYNGQIVTSAPVNGFFIKVV